MLKSRTKLLIIGQSASATMTLMATFITAKYCKSDIYGFCVILLFLGNLVGDVIDFGKCSWSTRELAANRMSLVSILRKLHRQGLFALSSLILCPLLVVFSPTDGLSILLACLLPFFWLRVTYIQQLLITMSHIEISIALLLAEKSAWLITLPMFIYFGDEIALFFTPILIGQAIHSLVGLRILRRMSQEMKMPVTDEEWDKRSIHEFGKQSLITDLSGLDNLIIGTFSSLGNSASYSLSTRVRNPLLLGVSALNSVLRPHFSRKDLVNAKKIFISESYLISINVLCVIGLALFAFFSVDSLFKGDYPNINIGMTLGILSILPHIPLSLMANFLQSTGSESYVKRFSLYITAFSLICLILLGVSGELNVITGMITLLVANTGGMFILIFRFLRIWKSIEGNRV